jgi:outer membrane receptor protein involved in Fe transport
LGIAYAQTEAPAPHQTEAAAPGEQTESAEPREEVGIVVTGSRIPRRDFIAVSPIVTMGAEQIEQAGQATIEFGLNALPQMFTGTTSTAIQNRTGRASLDLRGLGESRSLVLLDGRRIQPATASGSVDVTSLPSAIIESVETITGGASAVYGSDAMAGVVNFRLRRNFSGVMADAQFNVTEHGGGGSQEYNLVMGDDFANDAGNAMLVLSYADRNQLRRSDRDFIKVSTVNTRLIWPILNLSANPPSQAVVDEVFGAYGAAPGAVSRTTNIGVNNDLTLFTPAPGGTREIINFRGEFDDGTLLRNNRIVNNQGFFYDLISPITRFSAFGRVTHSITDDIDWFGQAMFSSYENINTVAPQQIGTAGTTASIPPTNPFIPADLQTLLASRASPNAPAPLTYTFLQFGGQVSDTDWSIYQLATGLDGELGYRDWSWSAYVSHGRTQQNFTFLNTYSVPRLQQLLNAADGGASICAGGLNIFGPHEDVSRDCLDYISAAPNNLLTIKQSVVEGTLEGSLFTLPGGDVSFALGADWRNEYYREQNDDEAIRGDIPGLTFAPSATGDRDVYEVFGELLVPLLSDAPLAKRLEFNLGYRYSEYEDAEGVESYTGSFNWAPVDAVTFRAGYSRAIRAPSLEDLFASAVAVSLPLGTPSPTSTAGDPCDVRSSFRSGPNAAQIRELCIGLGVPASAVDSYTLDRNTLFGDATGNPNLTNESADTYTVGLILESPFSAPLLSGLRLSVDYFDIEITDGIGQLPLATAFARCFNLDGVSNPDYDPGNINCGFFPRDPDTGIIRRIESRTLNLAQYQTTGVDMHFEWSVDTADLGVDIGGLNLNVVTTYLDSFRIQELPNSPLLDYAGHGGRPRALPRWKSLTSLTHSAGPFETTLRWRYASEVKDISLVANPNAAGVPPAGSYNYFDLSFLWEISDSASVRLGIQNLTDVEPYALGTTPENTDLVLYDPIGRNYTLVLRKTF